MRQFQQGEGEGFFTVSSSYGNDAQHAPSTSLAMHSKAPFLIHFLLAIPATINFYLLSRPPKAATPAPSASNETSQVASTTPLHGLPEAQISAVIRNYSFSLLSSCLTALTVYRWIDRPASTTTTGLGSSIYNDLAASLAAYHIGPILRALGRVFGSRAAAEGDRLVSTRGNDLGGPILHLVLHVVVMGALLREALR